MLDKVHAHILEELKINARVDTIFVLSAIILNFITLSINSALASSRREHIIIMLCFVTLMIVVSIVSVIALTRGRQSSGKLIKGLMEMYKDNGVDKYYDEALLEHHKSRYNSFLIVILVTGMIAIIVPFIGI